MYRFIVPRAHGNVFQITIKADSLQAAFAEYVAEHWDSDIEPAIAVWEYQFLVAQILPRYNFVKRDFEAILFEIPPPTGGP